MRITAVVLVCFLAVAETARAEYAIGYAEDGYTYSGENLWAKGDTLYTRTYHEYTGYTNTYNGYGGYYRTPQVYYYWSYTPQLSPKSTDAEWIAWARERERKAASAAATNAAHTNFLEKLAKFGISPPPPGIADYGGSAFSFRQAYVPPLQGATAYGYSQQIVADLYQPVDVNAAIQAMALAGKWSQEATREAGNNLAGVTAQVVAGNERVALAREDTRRVIETIRESRPPNRITTTITGSGQGPAFPAVPPKEGPAAEPNAAVSVASNQCLSCHSGASPSGKLDMSKPPTEEMVRKMAYRMSLPLTDKGHMPAAAEGKPGKQLSVSEMMNVLGEAAKASTPKP